MIRLENLKSIKQLTSAQGSPFSEGALRWLIFNAEENGLDVALIRVGRRVFLDIERFSEWLEERRGGGVGQQAE